MLSCHKSDAPVISFASQGYTEFCAPLHGYLRLQYMHSLIVVVQMAMGRLVAIAAW